MIENRSLDKVYSALATLPFFEGVLREDVRLEPLGSLTNTSYKVTVGGDDYMLRLPGEGTGEYIDRGTEEHNARLAAGVGINAPVLYFDPADGTMVSGYVEGETMDAAWLRRHPETLVRAARTLRRVHSLGRDFEYRFDVSDMIERYLELLHRRGVRLPDVYIRIEREAGKVSQALAAAPMPLLPCHNDPWPANFIDTGSRMYLVDWEFSGMNDPFWDLGDFSVETSLSPAQDRTMMEAYRGGAAPPALYSRLELYKVMSDLLWSLWSLVEHANGNPADDFAAYAQERFGRCRERIDSPGFGRHLKVVRNGRRSTFRKAAPRRHETTDGRAIR